jgi:hypothetical protein
VILDPADAAFHRQPYERESTIHTHLSIRTAQSARLSGPEAAGEQKRGYSNNTHCQTRILLLGAHTRRSRTT